MTVQIDPAMDRSEEITVQPLPELASAVDCDWEQLATCIGANFSLSPGWTAVTARSHRIAEQTEVVTVRRNQTLHSVLPITMSRQRLSGVTLRVLDLASNFVGYHNVPVTTLQPVDLLDILLPLARERGADVMRFAAIPDEARFGRYLKQNLKIPGCITQTFRGETSPYLTLTSDWNLLLASKSKKFRYKVRKRSETFEASGDLKMSWFSEPQECTELLDAMSIVEVNSWKKAAGISIFDREHERRYHEALLPFLSTNKAMYANVLYCDQTPIAYNLCCIRNGWVGQLKTSFDATFSELSPGSMVIDHAIRRAIDLGANEFDFLGNPDPHKLAWTKDVRSHTDYFLFLSSSVKGRLLGTAKQIQDRFRNARKQ